MYIPFCSLKMLTRILGIDKIRNKVKVLRLKAHVGAEKAKENAVRGAIVVLAFGFLLWLSIFVYILFYYTYVPLVVHTRPIYLQFETCEDSKKAGPMCSFPSAHIKLTQKHQLLMVGQRYSVSVELELPESETNRQQGMFLVCVELTSNDGTLLSHGCRTALMQYRSWLVRTIRAAFFAPAFLMGSAEEKQTMRVEIISDFVDDKTKPATDAYIEIRSKWLQLYSAKLEISAHFSGLRYMMYHWPILSATVGVSLILGFLLLALGLSWQTVAEGDGIAARATRNIRDHLTALLDDEEKEDNFENALSDRPEDDAEFLLNGKESLLETS